MLTDVVWAEFTNAIMDRMHTSGRAPHAHKSTGHYRCASNLSLFGKLFQASAWLFLVLFTNAWGADFSKDSGAGGLRISTQAETGFVRFFGTQPGFPRHLKQSSGPQSRQDVALAFAKEYGAAFGIIDPDSQLTPLDVRPRSSALKSKLSSGILSTMPRSVGDASLHFGQLHRGVPVLAGEFVVNLDSSNALLSMNGEIATDLAVSVTPDIGPDDAIDTALLAVAKWYKLDPIDLQVSQPKLFVYDSRLLKPSVTLPSLVWRMDVSTTELAPIREMVLVDAHSGQINLHFNQVDTAKSRKTYDASGMSVLPGTLMCSEGDAYPACAQADADVISAHDHAGDAYDFYLAMHQRDGIDGAGAVISSTVHYNDTSGTCPNAFWDGTQMVYCDGYAEADDVVGHELTHGVTSHESNLIYYFQSGAMNESFSDIWGEFIDLSNSTGNDSPSSRWLMGEDMPSGAIRDMQFPDSFGDPDRMTSNLYWTSSSDNGGVHSNSGVGNKAAYLMTDGDTFNGITVNGLGVTKTAKIYYEAQTNLLTSGANYADLYDALYQACLNLVGTSGITANDCLEVRAATDAVEMNSSPPGFSPAAALCPGGEQQGTVLFSDDLESGSSQWSTDDLTGAVSNWSLTGGYATSGVTSLRGANPGHKTDAVVFNTAPVVLASNAYLHFRHSYSFESWAGNYFYDGGVIEYSTDGSTWHDLGTLWDEGQDYNETIDTSNGNPLAGRMAFTSESHGYVSSRYDLGTLAGENFQIRFRVGTDVSVAGPLGWVIDDVNIYQCGASVAPPPAPCSGTDVLVQNKVFDGATVCAATSTMEANTQVVVKTGAAVEFQSPATTLGAGFSVELGGAFTIMAGS